MSNIFDLSNAVVSNTNILYTYIQFKNHLYSFK